MRQFIIAVAILSAASMSAFAQNGSNNGQQQGGKNYGAPGPVIGAGLPLLAAGGIGYGVYWLVRRRRSRKNS
jgi:hypothetical protein